MSLASNNLYGRPPKKQRRGTEQPCSLDFTAQMTALMSNDQPRAKDTNGRRRAEQSSFASRSGTYRSRYGCSNTAKTQTSPSSGGDGSELQRSREKLEEKARLYSGLKRGVLVSKSSETTSLVDFDKKWADTAHRAEEPQTSDSDPFQSGDDDVIEFEDEFGRTRRGTRAEKAKLKAWHEKSLFEAEEIENAAARPHTPQTLIHGDTIQTMAFNPQDSTKMKELARKRDRSATPPDEAFYDADGELRDKGVGFYKFSKDKELRNAQLRSLQEQHRSTKAQQIIDKQPESTRQQQVELRKQVIEERKAKKMADSFLDTLANDM